MNGIVFYATQNYDHIVNFYSEIINCSTWLVQADCTVLQHGNMLLGFCQRERTDACGIICFYYPTRDDVDRMYEKLEDRAQSSPRENPQYEIYHFFATDPDGRTIEFQCFDRQMPGVN